MKIAIFGNQGQVAWELQRTLASLGEVHTLHRQGNTPVDLTNVDSIRKAIRTIEPQLIVNGAAYTAVDQAESETEVANAINHIAPAIMAEEALKLDALLIHYSTDYVFSGDGQQPYTESDLTQPAGVYGQTKRAGELAIQTSGCKHFILRTAWVYGSRGKNFLLTMLRLMAERDKLGVVADQFGAPTWSRQIAEATALLAAQCRTESGFSPKRYTDGIYHLTSQGSTSWHGFAELIQQKARNMGLLAKPQPVPVNAISTSDYPTPAKRPAYSVLDNSRLKNDYGIQLPEWENSLQQCLEELALK